MLVCADVLKNVLMYRSDYSHIGRVDL